MASTRERSKAAPPLVNTSRASPGFRPGTNRWSGVPSSSSPAPTPLPPASTAQTRPRPCSKDASPVFALLVDEVHKMVSVVLAVSLASLSHQADGGMPPSRRTWTVTLRSTNGRGVSEAPAIERVLEAAFGVTRTMNVDNERVAFEVTSSRLDLETVRSVLKPHSLRLQLLAADQGRVLPSKDAKAPTGVRRFESLHEGELYGAQDCAALARVIARVRKASKLLAACECGVPQSNGSPLCVARVLEHEAVIEGRFLESAVPTFEAGNFEVEMKFTPDGAAALRALTTHAIGRRLALMLDERILVSPKVSEPIADGRVRLTIPPRIENPTQEQLQGVVSLAAEIQSGALRGGWSVEWILESRQ
jgi:hypothetical protein